MTISSPSQSNMSQSNMSKSNMFNATWRSVLALATLPVIAPAASAASLYDTYFGPGHAGACFARAYDAAHLAAHPAQAVTHMTLEFDDKTTNDALNTPERFELGLALRIKGKDEWYGAQAVCADRDGAIECFLEGDGGRFQLTAADDGALKLETGSYGIALEGSDFVELSGSSGDDKVFLLTPAKDDCATAAKALQSSDMQGMEGGTAKAGATPAPSSK